MVTIDRQLNGSTERRTGDGLALAKFDRSREFAAARHRTTVVRTLRVVFPLCAVGLFGVYVFAIVQKAGVISKDALTKFAISKVLPTDLVMKNPRYEGFNDDGGSYVLTAKTAQPDIERRTVVVLNEIVGEVYQADKSRTDITATQGRYDSESGILNLLNEINVDSQTGLKARLSEATLHTKEDLLTSSNPVLIEFPNGAVRARQMTLRQKAREATFSEDVEATLTPPQDQKTEPPGEVDPGATQGALFAPSNGPIHIESQRLDLSDNSKKAVFSGNVRARQGDANMTTPELEVTYEGEGLMGATGKTANAADAAASAAGKVRRILAKKPVVMKRDNGDVVTSDTADFDAPSQTALLTGDVIMTSGADRRARSDTVELNEATGAILLSGAVLVTQGGNELHGGRLAIDRKRGTAELTTPPEGAYGPGRIKARLVREANAKLPTKAAADTDDSGMASFRTNPAAPIELNADALEIDDGRKAALFRGDVDAIRDGFTIRSAQLSAFYKGGSGLMDVAVPGTARADRNGESSELTRLEARKDVRVTARNGDAATGDWADYDAKTNTITMGGNVVLSRGKSMVRGTRLLIDLTTGESKIDTAPANTQSKPSGGGWVTSSPSQPAASGKGRASAVFFPQELKEQENAAPRPADKSTGTGAAVDGWSSTGTPD